MSSQPYPPDPRTPGYPPPPPNQVPDVDRQTVHSANDGNVYAESQHESYVDPAGNRVESRSEVIEDENLSRANTLYWSIRLINFLFGLLEVILLLRFIFRLLAANQYSPFVAFLYNLSYPFVAPFKGIFTDPGLLNGSVLEVSTIVAMIVYGLICWGLVSLVRIMLAPNLSGRQSVTMTRRRRVMD